MEQFIGAKFLSGRNSNIKAGIVGYSTGKTLEVIGNVGIGSTIFNPVADLDVRGSVYIRDTLTADTFNLVYDNLIIGGNLSVAGIGTINTLRSNSGIITTLSGTNLNYSGIGTINTLSGTTVTYNTGNLTTANISTGIVTSLSGTNLNYSGIGTINTLRSSTGIVTSLSGTNLNYSGIGTLGVTSTTNLTSQQLFVSGVSTFIGAITGTISTATKLQNARTFEITGDIVASPISFDGTGNVSLAATIQPNSVGLGTDTFGDYVKVISGTANQIDVTGGTGEGSTPVISFAPNPTIPGNVTIGNDLQVNNNLNVTGNITVGGTAGYILVENFRVSDADIILGFTTDSQGNDASTDTTANHGGIAVASTEGNPLVNLNIAGIETLPPTYKKIMWFKAGAFAGLNTDAWLSNYAIGIGSTQFPSGTRLAAGSVQFTENDLAVVRNINASGVVTASNFVGTLTGNASSATFATNAGIATYADIAGFSTFSGYSNVAGIATYADIAGIATNVIGGIASVTQLNVSGVSTFSGITTHTESLFGTQASFTGVVTALSFTGDGSQLTGVTGTQIVTQDLISTPVFLTFANNAGVTSLGIATTGSNVLSYIPTSGNLGIGTIDPTSKLDVRGDVLVSGVVTASSFVGTLTGNASSATFATTAGISTNVIGGIASVTQLNVSGVSTLGIVTSSQLYVSGVVTATQYFGDGSQLTGVTGTQVVSQPFTSTPVYPVLASNAGVSSVGIATTGSTALVFIPSTGNLGIGTTDPTSKLDVRGDILVSGASTLGRVQISSGIVTASSGIVTYYGDGSNLQGIISGITIQDETSVVGLSVTTLNFTGATISVSNAVNGISTVTVIESGIATYASVAGIATYASVAGIATYADNAGIATYASVAGIATYADNAGIATYASVAGIATYADNAGIATNLKGGLVGNIPYQSATDTTVFLANGSSGTILQSNGVGNAPTWVSAAPAAAITGLTVRDEGIIVGSANSVSELNFVGAIVSATSSAGIATITFVDYVSNAGVSTYASLAGIATFATNAGVSTYASLAGIATYASVAGIATFATNAGVATALQNLRTFEITGDIVASPIAFDGTGNVSLAATIQPNSVGLGTDTTGDYVQSITGTANQISVSVISGEGSAPTLSFPNQVTIPQDLTVLRDVQVNRNLNVTGNITIGGTSATLFTETFKVSDADIILGVRTDGNGNDISTDTTANHGGIAIASTEGNPLVILTNPGVGETLPATYKKIMWFKEGSFAGLGTDAWLFNYAVGIGSTQFPSGTRLAAGSVQFTENDLAVVRNINASGVVTASSFSGNSSTATFATNSGIATYADNAGIATYASLAGIATFATNAGVATYASVAGIATYASLAGIATFATNAGIATFATNSGIATYADNAGIATYSDNAGITTFATNAGIATFATNAGIATFATSAGVSTSVIGGIGSIIELQVTGVSTFTNGPVLIGTGTSTGTASQRLQVTDGAYVSGSIGIGTTNPTSKLHVIGDVLVVGVVTATDFNSASDAKLKTNIQPIADPLEKVTQIQGVSFNWIKDNKPSMGVIADELQEVLPELVSDTDPKTVNYNGLIGLLIEVVKEQQEKIQSLEQRITRLE